MAKVLTLFRVGHTYIFRDLVVIDIDIAITPIRKWVHGHGHQTQLMLRQFHYFHLDIWQPLRCAGYWHARPGIVFFPWFPCGILPNHTPYLWVYFSVSSSLARPKHVKCYPSRSPYQSNYNNKTKEISNNSIINIKHHALYQVPSILRIQNLGKNIYKVVISRNTASKGLYHYQRFHNGMLAYIVKILLQPQFWSLSVMYDRHVINIRTCPSHQWDNHHP